MDVKKRTDADWSDLHVFAALARHGTLSAAARALKLNHATIARRIAALERSLDAKLVERRPHNYALTARGQTVLDAVAAMESAYAQLAAAPETERGETDQKTRQSAG